MPQFKIVGKRPVLTATVSEAAMSRAIVKLIEKHKEEFNGILAAEVTRLSQLKCSRIIRP